MYFRMNDCCVIHKDCKSSLGSAIQMLWIFWNKGEGGDERTMCTPLKGSGDAKKALKNLLKSGIPGIEGMFGGQDAQPKVGRGFS